MDVNPLFQGIVLLGPPGSGKTFIGHLLAQQGIAHYTNLEEELLHRFGQGTTFAKNKAAALQFIQQHYESALESASRPVAIESTGVSDRPMLVSLEKKHTIIFINIATPQSVCVERVQARVSGENLNNDSSFTEQFYTFWSSEIEPTYRFALTVDGTDAEEAVTKIREFVYR